MAYPSTNPNDPNTGPGGLPAPSPTGGCNCSAFAYEVGHPCYAKCKGGTPETGACPPGQEKINGVCRYPGDFPCPPGQCKDSVTGICRSPGKNEKVRESDGSDVRGLCKQRDGGGAGGAGGAGGGGGAGGAAPGAPKLPGADFSKLLGIGTGANEPGGLLSKKLMELLNQGTRFTPEVQQAYAANQKQYYDAQAQREVDATKAQQAQSGTYTSNFANAQQGSIRREAAGRLGGDLRTFQLEKAKADFDDKLNGIKAAQDWLDGLRSFAATLDQTAADREKTAATIALGYAQIAAQKSMLAQQLASNKDLLGMQLNSAEWLALLRMQQPYI